RDDTNEKKRQHREPDEGRNRQAQSRECKAIHGKGSWKARQSQSVGWNRTALSSPAKAGDPVTTAMLPSSGFSLSRECRRIGRPNIGPISPKSTGGHNITA